MAFSIDDLATLFKGIQPDKRPLFNTALRNLAGQEKDAKSADMGRINFVFLKSQTPSSALAPLFDHLIADAKAGGPTIKVILNDPIIKNDCAHLIKLIAVMAEDLLVIDEAVVTEPPLTPSFSVQMQTGAFGKDIGLAYLEKHQYDKAFWYYLCEIAIHRAAIPEEVLGFAMFHARNELFPADEELSDAKSVASHPNVHIFQQQNILAKHQALLLSALAKCYAVRVVDQRTGEIQALLKGYIDLLEAFRVAHFDQKNIFKFVETLNEAPYIFANLVGHYLGDSDAEKYRQVLSRLSTSAFPFNSFHLKTTISQHVEVVADAKVSNEIEAKMPKGLMVHPIEEGNADLAHPGAISMAPSRANSTPTTPRASSVSAGPTSTPNETSPSQPKRSLPSSPAKKQHKK